MSDRNEFTGPQTTAFYGDQIRWFVGTVIEKGNDSPQLGRVKVRILGIHGPEVSNHDIPYAQVLIPTTEPGTSGLGCNSALEPSAAVFGIFLDGKQSQLPLVLGSLPVVNVPSLTQIEAGIAWSNSGSPGVGAPATIDGALAGPPSSFFVDPNIEYGGNTQYAWSYFRSTGTFTDIAIAALLGNFLVESGGGKPFDIRTSVRGDLNLNARGSLGIAQWYAGTSRQDNLIRFAKERGGSETDLTIQLQFVEYEFITISEYDITRLNNYNSIGPATVYVHQFYENPQNTGARSAYPNETRDKKGIAKLKESERIGYAKSVFETFTRKTKSSAF